MHLVQGGEAPFFSIIVILCFLLGRTIGVVCVGLGARGDDDGARQVHPGWVGCRI